MNHLHWIRHDYHPLRPIVPPGVQRHRVGFDARVAKWMDGAANCQTGCPVYRSGQFQSRFPVTAAQLGIVRFRRPWSVVGIRSVLPRLAGSLGRVHCTYAWIGSTLVTSEWTGLLRAMVDRRPPSTSGRLVWLLCGGFVDTAAVQARGLTKRFGKLTAVDVFTLDVAGGDVVGFLGPNGSGKTTTIRMLMGFLRPTSGTVTVLGAPAGTVAVRARIGYLPGDLRVDPSLTGRELFAWYGRLRGRHDDSRVDGLCERLALDPTRAFGALSKGNRQKVGIVQAFCHEPDLLILDEPTTGLDPLVQREFLALVVEAAARGAAVLFSSHVLPEVERAATRIAIIRDGCLVTVSGVDDLLDRARRRLELRYSGPVAAAAFNRVPGVAHVDVDGPIVTLTVDGPVGPAMRAAADAGTLLRVSPAGDDLEDLFVSLYHHPGGADPTQVH